MDNNIRSERIECQWVIRLAHVCKANWPSLAQWGCLVCFLLTATAAQVQAQTVVFQDSAGRHGTVDLRNPGEHALPPGKPTVCCTKQGGITFNVYYKDVINASGFGFDDPVRGEGRRACVAEVLDYLNEVLVETGTCDVLVMESWSNAETGTLASSGTYFFPLARFDNGFAFHHITTGVDPEPPCVAFTAPLYTFSCWNEEWTYRLADEPHLPDLFLMVNFVYAFQTDRELPPVGYGDLRTILLHEFTHGLGFHQGGTWSWSLDCLSGEEIQLIFPTGPTKFSSFLQTGNGDWLWGRLTGCYIASLGALLGRDNGVVFAGSHATAVYGSAPPIYAPDPWEQGSSLAHWAWGHDGGNAVMEPGLYLAEEVMREYSLLDIAALQDLGYRTSIDPEEFPEPPRAGFSFSPDSGSAPLTVTFTDESIPGSDPIESWLWFFGDDTHSEEQNPTHTFEDPGTYWVYLMVRTATRSDIKIELDAITVSGTITKAARNVVSPGPVCRFPLADALPPALAMATLSVAWRRAARRRRFLAQEP